MLQSQSLLTSVSSLEDEIYQPKIEMNFTLNRNIKVQLLVCLFPKFSKLTVQKGHNVNKKLTCKHFYQH